MDFWIQAILFILPIIVGAFFLVRYKRQRKKYAILCAIFLAVTLAMVALLDMHRNVVLMYAVCNVVLIGNLFDKNEKG